MRCRSVDGVRIHLAPAEFVTVQFLRAGAPEGSFAWGVQRRGDLVVPTLYCLPPYDNPMLHGLPVTTDRGRADKVGDLGVYWWWDGNEDAPTLAPSIGCGRPPYVWHGYLRRGRFEACE